MRPRRHQPLEGPAALQLLRLVGSVGARVGLLRHARGGHGWLQPDGGCQDPAQRPRSVLRARGQVLQLGPALPAPHQHPRRRYLRVLLLAQAGGAPAQRHMQLLAY